MANEKCKPRMPLFQKVYKGVLMFENEIEEIENMDTREDDIWVITFPRSGKLLQEYIALILNLMLKHNILTPFFFRYFVIVYALHI